MSRAYLIEFPDRVYHEFGNAFGGAAYIWDALWKAYISKDPIGWMMGNAQPLWDLADDPRLERFERIVLLATFDRFYVLKDGFEEVASAFSKFVMRYGTWRESRDVLGRDKERLGANVVCHLLTWAQVFRETKALAIGFYHTSVGEDVWVRYPEGEDDPDPENVPLEEGTNLFEALAEIEQQLEAKPVTDHESAT